VAALLGAVGLCLGVVGCRSYEVTITGEITRYDPVDTVFVTLTKTWDTITAPPERFTIDSSGRFELVFTTGVLRPPITFVKNDTLYARLTTHNLGEVSPILYDEVRNRSFELVLEDNRTARAEVIL
jgi:hypothetical protein